MRSVLAMALKDLRIISRDWMGMFFIVAFPVMMGTFFGSIYGSFGEEPAAISIAVVDEDQSPMSQRFVEGLGEGGRLNVQQIPKEEAQDKVRRGELLGLIVVPESFGETAGMIWQQESPALQLGLDPSRKAEGAMLEGLIMQSAGKLVQERLSNPASMIPLISDAREEVEKAEDISPSLRPLLTQMLSSLENFLTEWAEANAAEQQAEGGEEGEPSSSATAMEIVRIERVDVTRQIAEGSQEALVRKIRSAWDISFPSAMMWGVLSCAATFAITIVRERKQGTLLRLQVAPVSWSQVLAGKGLACYLTILGVVALMVALGVTLGMRPRSYPLLVLATGCVAFCFVGIMMLMSVIGKTEEAVGGAAWGIFVILAMFGGGMIPLAFLPDILRMFSDLSPVKWSVLALEGAIWRDFAFSEMLLPCGVLLGIGGACLTAGVMVLARSRT